MKFARSASRQSPDRDPREPSGKAALRAFAAPRRLS
jgi:hypothetical protein